MALSNGKKNKVGFHTCSSKGVSMDSSPVCWDSISLCWAVALLRTEEKNSPAYKLIDNERLTKIKRSKYIMNVAGSTWIANLA